MKKSKMKQRVSLHLSFFLVVAVACLLGVAQAAVPPAYDNLAPLTENVQMPTDVAVDQQGRVFIAETTRNRVTVLTQSGKFTGKMVSVPRPISVAIDAQGRLLVGSAADGSVSIYGSDLSRIGTLGVFGKPMDIAVDSAGTIYVVDKDNNAIVTYGTGGTGSIGTPGTSGNVQAAGELWHPVAIAIDENAGEIVVLHEIQNRVIDPHFV